MLEEKWRGGNIKRPLSKLPMYFQEKVKQYFALVNRYPDNQRFKKYGLNKISSLSRAR
jgi:hypothetical protein